MADILLVFGVRQQLRGLKLLTILLMSMLLIACGGGSEGGDAGLEARLNPDGSPTTPGSSSGTGSTPASGTTPVSGNSNLSFNINAPAQLSFGSPVTINASTSNAQGNVTYALSGAPAGMTIDTDSGEISWTPSGLSFGKDSIFSFRVSATDDAGTNTTTTSISVTDTSRQPLVRSSAQVPTKQNAIHVGDFNGDGDNEVLITDNISLIYTLKWDDNLNNGQGDFYQEWVYPYSLGNQANIDAIDAVDVNGDTRLDIIVLNGNTVSVIDGVSRTLAYSYEIADAAQGYAVFARNIDTDTDIEIVTLVSKGSAQEQLNIFTLPTGSSRTLNNDWASPVDNYGTAMVIGNMDFSDNQLEIATSAGYVIDGVSLQDEWIVAKPPNGFGDQLVAADLDGDDVKEIVGLFSNSGNGQIEVFALHEQSGLFGETSTNRDPETTTCSITVVDSDNNGLDEVFTGECVDGGTANGELLNILTAANRASFSEKLLYRQRGDERLHAGFVALTAGDVDNDGDMDIVWANKETNNKYDAITVVDLAASLRDSEMVIVKQNTTLGLFDTAFTGAVDYRHTASRRYATFMSNIEPVEGNDNSFTRESRFAFIDYTDGRVNLSSAISATKAVVSGQKIMAADIAGAGYDQLVLSSALTRNNIEYSAYQIVDYKGNAAPAVEATHGGWIPGSNNPLGGLEGDLSTVFDLTDLDGNSDLELVGFIDNYLYSYDLIPDRGQWQASQNWQSVRLDGQGIDVAVDDLDADGIKEVVHLTSAGLYIRKRDDYSLHPRSDFYDTVFLFANLYQASALTAMQVVDINADGQKEIVISARTDNGGTVYVLDNRANVLVEVAVEGEVTDFQKGQTANSILAAWTRTSDASNYISEFAISADLQQVTEIMRSPALLGAVSPHSMNYSDDGRLLVGTRFGMYITR